MSLINDSLNTLLEKETVDKKENITCLGADGKILNLDWTDDRICDGVIWDCKMGRDERTCGFHSQLKDILVISVRTGANTQNSIAQRVSGLYIVEKDSAGNPGYYKHSNATSYIYRSNGAWLIGIGQLVKDNIPYYVSGKSEHIPETGWVASTNRRSAEILLPKENSDIRVDSISSQFADKVTSKQGLRIDGGTICKIKSGGWEYLEHGNEKLCDGEVYCDQGLDEYQCKHHLSLANSTFLIISGTTKGQDGIYEMQNDDLGNPGHFKQINGSGHVKRFQNKWTIADGPSRDNLVVLYFSNSNDTLEETGWKDRLGTETETRVTLVPPSINLAMLSKTEEEYDVPEGLLCTENRRKQKGGTARRLLIRNIDRRKCDETWDCDKGGDEANCEMLEKETLIPSITVTSMIFQVGLVIQLSLFAWRKRKRRLGIVSQVPLESRRTTENLLAQNRAKDIVDSIIRSVDEDSTEMGSKIGNGESDDLNTVAGKDEQYKKLHKDIDGGVQLLVNTGFSLLSSPWKRHRLANFILTEESKFHKSEEEVLKCLRKKGRSSEQMALCLDHFQRPSCLKRFLHFIEQPLHWLLRSTNTGVRFTAALLLGIIPIAKVTFFMWDFIKDTALVIYLWDQRWNHIEFETIKGLIVAYGVSLAVSSFIMCCTIQITKDNGIKVADVGRQIYSSLFVERVFTKLRQNVDFARVSLGRLSKTTKRIFSLRGGYPPIPLSFFRWNDFPLKVEVR